MATSTATQAVETIVKARDLLVKHGWVQNTESRNGQRCLIRALRDADGPGEIEAVRIVSCLIGTNIPSWNDRPGRTFAEVRTLLDAAEHIAKELAE